MCASQYIAFKENGVKTAKKTHTNMSQRHKYLPHEMQRLNNSPSHKITEALQVVFLCPIALNK